MWRVLISVNIRNFTVDKYSGMLLSSLTLLSHKEEGGEGKEGEGGEEKGRDSREGRGGGGRRNGLTGSVLPCLLPGHFYSGECYFFLCCYLEEKGQ